MSFQKITIHALWEKKLSETSIKKAARKQGYIVLFIVVFSLIIRLPYIIGSSFPLHDGGFFYVMVRDLLKNDLLLPAYSSFNNANIPFIYPPFGLYFVAILERIFDIDGVLLFKIIPFVLVILLIPVFYEFSKEFFENENYSLTATLVFSLLPFSYEWLILGGGVTRGFGAIFCLLSLTFLFRNIKRTNIPNSILCVLFCGLTVLSHPEWAWFIVYSIGLKLLLMFLKNKRKALIISVITFFGTLLVVSPWLIAIFDKHRWTIVRPFFESGFSRWAQIMNLLAFNWSGEVIFPVVTIFAVIGVFFVFRSKKHFLLLWLPAVFFLQGRAADQKAVVPLALIAGVGVLESMIFFKNQFNGKRASWALFSAITYAVIICLLGLSLRENNFIKPLSETQLEGLQWFDKNVQPDSTFVVLTGNDWPLDNLSEWTVALTGRESISVVQGYEWLPSFSDRVKKYGEIRDEFGKGIQDLYIWFDQNNLKPNYLIIQKTSNGTGSNSLAGAHLGDLKFLPDVKTVFENKEIVIVETKYQ